MKFFATTNLYVYKVEIVFRKLSKHNRKIQNKYEHVLLAALLSNYNTWHVLLYDVTFIFIAFFTTNTFLTQSLIWISFLL